eukprot:14050760-Ditylum_brightwellii.AAC.1
MGVKNSVIMMDNSRYHKTLPEGTPKMSWPKQWLIKYCHLKNIPIIANDLKSVLWGKVKALSKNM